ncbi:hypothetical protein NIES4074_65770 (plasmid) [Cylindrospermum sp. NIES-4074]|nr:hypothetical protein NIES4074_65770 [Cylindrospermum sp. NIES-4074]
MEKIEQKLRDLGTFIKQQWLVIYTSSINIIVFYKKTQDVEHFRSTVLTLARQLNSPPAQKTQNSPPHHLRCRAKPLCRGIGSYEYFKTS